MEKADDVRLRLILVPPASSAQLADCPAKLFLDAVTPHGPVGRTCPELKEEVSQNAGHEDARVQQGGEGHWCTPWRAWSSASRTAAGSSS